MPLFLIVKVIFGHQVPVPGSKVTVRDWEELPRPGLREWLRIGLPIWISCPLASRNNFGRGELFWGGEEFAGIHLFFLPW